MTTVISTTEDAGCEVMMRWILGRWSEASNWVRSPIWARTRSVVQPTVCRIGREPASISTITWANCLGNAAAWPVAPGAASARAWASARSLGVSPSLGVASVSPSRGVARRAGAQPEPGRELASYGGQPWP